MIGFGYTDIRYPDAVAASVHACTVCPPGSGRLDRSLRGDDHMWHPDFECAPCPSGTFSADGRECLACPGGKTSRTDRDATAGASTCADCSAGQFSALRTTAAILTTSFTRNGRVDPAPAMVHPTVCKSCGQEQEFVAAFQPSAGQFSW
jgi:hypothetical protein